MDRWEGVGGVEEAVKRGEEGALAMEAAVGTR